MVQSIQGLYSKIFKIIHDVFKSFTVKILVIMNFSVFRSKIIPNSK